MKLDKATIRALNMRHRQLIVNLDGSRPYTCVSKKELDQALANPNIKQIITPLTTAINTYYCLHDWELIVESDKKALCVNDLILDGSIRIAQNAEKMILGGIFDNLVRTDWEGISRLKSHDISLHKGRRTFVNVDDSPYVQQQLTITASTYDGADRDMDLLLSEIERIIQ